MSLLHRRIERIKAIEAKKRQKLGEKIVIKSKSNKRECPDCEIDEDYGAPVGNCDTCNGDGYIYDYNETELDAIVEWNVEIGKFDTKAGVLNEGDCVVEVAYSNRSLIEDTVNKDYEIHISGHDYFATNYETNKMATKVLFACRKVREDR